MAKSDLLKEAIADAKAVKETALANAKIALQEAFAPRIENMLSAKLSEDLSEDDDSNEDETRDTPVTQIDITRDMEKWMELIQTQYETYRDNAVRELFDILSLESI